jgi:hypothetical protein
MIRFEILIEIAFLPEDAEVLKRRVRIQAGTWHNPSIHLSEV